MKRYELYFQLAHASQSGRAQNLYEKEKQTGSQYLGDLKKNVSITNDYFMNYFRELEVKYLLFFNSWNRFHEKVMYSYKRLLTDEQKAFFKTDVIYNIQIHRLLLKWSIQCLSAIKAHGLDNTGSAIEILENSKTTLDDLDAEIAFIERGQYKGWYTDRVWNKSPLRWKLIPKNPFEEIRIDLIQQLENKQ